MGSVAAGGLIETYSDAQETLDLSEVLTENVFALTVNGDSMVDAFIADGDMVLMEPVNSIHSLRNGTIVCAMVPGSGTTLKYFSQKNNVVTLEAANQNYEPIRINADLVEIQEITCCMEKSMKSLKIFSRLINCFSLFNKDFRVLLLIDIENNYLYYCYFFVEDSFLSRNSLIAKEVAVIAKNKPQNKFSSISNTLLTINSDQFYLKLSKI